MIGGSDWAPRRSNRTGLGFASWCADKRWPGEDSAGTHGRDADGLLGLLEGFTFERGLYQLDWEHWLLPDGLPHGSGPSLLMGVSIATTDPLLGNAVATLSRMKTASTAWATATHSW